MKLQREEFEQKFAGYRRYLVNEIHRFRDSVAVYRQIHERTVDNLSEINLAPAFFHITEDALIARFAGAAGVVSSG